MNVYRLFNPNSGKYISAGSQFRKIWLRKYDVEQHCKRYNNRLREGLQPFEVHTFELVRVGA